MIGSLVTAVVLAATPEAARNVPMRARLSPAEGVRFGVAEVCLRALEPGGAMDAAAFTGLSPRGKQIYPNQKAWWISPQVTVSASERGCTVRADAGDGAELRLVVLQSLGGASVRLQSDNGPASQDASGKLWRQESYCLTLGGAPAFMLISSSPSRGRTPLQATIGRDSRVLCR